MGMMRSLRGADRRNLGCEESSSLGSAGGGTPLSLLWRCLWHRCPHGAGCLTPYIVNSWLEFEVKKAKNHEKDGLERENLVLGALWEGWDDVLWHGSSRNLEMVT